MLSVNANGDTDNNNKENQENKNRYGRKRRHNTYNYWFSKRYAGLIIILLIATFLSQNATTRTKTTMTRTSTMVLSFSIVTIRTRALRHHHAIKTIPSLLRRYSKLDDFLSDTDGDVSRLVEQLEQKQKHVVVSNNNVIKTTDDDTLTMTSNSDNNNNNNNNNNNSWIDVIKFSEEKYGDNDDLQKQQQQTSSPSPSPVEVLTVSGRTIHIKHDDQLRLLGSGISGNKARKMWTLNEVSVSAFPKCLVSYGGPQSNSMLALAAITNYKNRELAEEEKEGTTIMNNNGSKNNNDNDNISTSTPIRFVYYTKKLPRFLRNQPNGNLFRALSLGMELKELSREEYSNLFEHRSEDNDGGGGREGKRPPIGLTAPAPDSLYVPQGGAFSSALVGVDRLSEEIYTYWLEHGNDRPLTIFVPGGTCTTALCLHHGLKRLSLLADRKDDDNNSDYSYSARSMMDIEVVVVPCVGDAAYARKQMMSLSTQIGAKADDIPTILQPEPEEQEKLTSSSRRKYFTFGKPNKEILETFQELQKENNLLVDLLYGAPSFAVMFRHWEEDIKNNKDKSSLSPDLSFDPNQPLSAGREIMYVHSGGLEGITSQLLRYQHIGLMKIKDVQLPGRRNKKKGTEHTNT